LPVIAIGFVLALTVTVFMARRNRAYHVDRDQASSEVDVPLLDIDTGGPSDLPAVAETRPSEPAMLADQAGPAARPVTDTAPLGKSPPLLSAKPKTPGSDSPELELHRPTEANEPRTAAKPVEREHPLVPEGQPVSGTSPLNEAGPGSADSAGEASPQYPSTDPSALRPGGRVPKAASVPNYPQTSTPYLR
jgi:hypothetical protein